ncbi:MAG: 4Fe-4S dicluster domain-containing protein [Firmicutes bacterium]|nr:4Fe-4S dicluster domain-containing protein [Bacillota bacterium]
MDKPTSSLNVDGKEVQVLPGELLLDVLKKLGVDIPTLCNHEGLEPVGSCRLCIVEVKERNRNRLVASCIYPAQRATEVRTNSPRVKAARQFLFNLLLARNGDNESIRQLAARYGIVRSKRLPVRPDKCTLCLRCVRACATQGIGAIGTSFRGRQKEVGPPFGDPPENCIGCAACARVCPAGAIEVKEKNNIREIWGQEFVLVRCERCGEAFATRKQLDWIEKELGQEVDKKLCPRCRQRAQAESMTKVGRNKREVN